MIFLIKRGLGFSLPLGRSQGLRLSCPPFIGLLQNKEQAKVGFWLLFCLARRILPRWHKQWQLALKSQATDLSRRAEKANYLMLTVLRRLILCQKHSLQVSWSC